MNYISLTPKAVWHDHLVERLILNDACAPLRIHLLQLQKWLIDIEKSQPSLLDQCLEEHAKIVVSVIDGNLVLYDYFIFPNPSTIWQFIGLAERSFRNLLTEHLAGPWALFLEELNRRPDYDAVENLRYCAHRVARRIADPCCPPALLDTYRENVRSNWENVYDVLTRSELVPMDAVANFLDSVHEFIMGQREQYGLPMERGQWTDTEDGTFVRVSRNEITEPSNSSATTSNRYNIQVITGTIEDLIDEISFWTFEEDGVELVNVKSDEIKLYYQTYREVVKCIERFTIGRIAETRLVEVLMRVLTDTTSLVEMHKKSVSRKKFAETRKYALTRVSTGAMVTVPIRVVPGAAAPKTDCRNVTWSGLPKL